MILFQAIAFLIVFSGLFLIVAVALRIFTKWQTPKLLIASLAGSAAILILLMVVSRIFRPVQPSRNDIMGHYEIDRSKHPGKQADWQHATYSMEITHGEVIVRDARTDTAWTNPIEWFHQPEYRWKFKDTGKRHHMIADGPALHRRSFGYFYVFHSPLYGDVFFTKK